MKLGRWIGHAIGAEWKQNGSAPTARIAALFRWIRR